MKTTRRSRRAAAIAAPALAAVLLLSGCGLNSPDEVITPSGSPASEGAEPVDRSASPEPSSDDPTATTDEPSEDDPTEGSDQTGISIDPKRAGEIAVGAHDGSRVVDLDLEREHGLTVWEVKVVTGEAKYEVDVDAVTGEIVKDERESTDDLREYNSQLDRAKLSYADAIDVVLEQYPGATVVELDLDEEDGAVVWEAEVVTADHVKYEMEIDAVSGKILQNERED